MTDSTEAEKIVAGLRSDVPAERQAALDTLYKRDTNSAVLIEFQSQTTLVHSTSGVDANRVFSSLLGVMENLGGHLGLTLKWVPEQPKGDELVVPHAGLMR